MKRCFFVGWLFAWFSATCGVAVSGPGLEFIENKNQWDSEIHFGAKVPGGSMFIHDHGFYYYLLDAARMEELHMQSHAHHIDESTGRNGGGDMIQGQVVSMTWLNAHPDSPKPTGRSDHYYNYFIGADAARWSSRAHAFERVLYPSLYPDIDLVVYSSGRHLKYDFMVAAGADPLSIQGRYAGADRVYLDEGGNLVVVTSVGELIEQRPYAYQYINGVKTSVSCFFELHDDVVSFCFPEGYDTCEPLVIDPLMIFSTYSGSTADNWGSTATPGERGTLYSAGTVNHVAGGSYPATVGAFQTSYGGLYDIGILKYDSTGTQLLYASYLGGSDSESPHSMVINADEELLLLGTTGSTNYPTSLTAFDRTYNGGVETQNVITYDNGSDIVITRISGDGTTILASTYLGGSDNDGMNPGDSPLVRNYGDELRGDIITDQAGNVYISSVTPSNDFPVVNGFNTTYMGGLTDAILVKLPPDLSAITWGAFVGGVGVDAAHTIKFDQNGDIILAGGTTSADFPVTVDSYQSALAGDVDGWIARVAQDGTALLHATYTGTSSYDQIYFVDLNEADEIYIYGQTNGGPSFLITPGVYHNPNSGQFIQKFSAGLDVLIFSTVVGSGRGIPDISPTAFLVNECNNLYISGWGGMVNSATGHWASNTRGMPVTPDAFQSTTSGSDFYFMVLTDDATEFLYGTYLGGNFSRTHVDGGTSRFDKSGIVYHAVCSGCAAFNVTNQSTSDFPTTPGAWSRINRSTNCNNAAFKFDLSSLRARLQTNSVKLDMPGLNRVCIPDKIVFQNRSTGGEFFQWNFGDGSPGIFTPDTSAIIHQYTTPGHYTVWLKAIDPGTCKVEDSTSTIVHVFIKQSVVQNDDDLCQDDAYTLWSTGGEQYYWISEDATFESFESSPVVTPEDTTTYYVTITEASGCVHRDTVILNVVPAVVPEFSLEQNGTCFERPSLRVINETQDATDAFMTFDFGDGQTSDLPEDVHAYEKDDVYTVKLIGVREFCVYEKSIAWPVFTLTVPNVITPDATLGYNDTFIIQVGEMEGATPADFDIPTSLIVYNRWGTKVYENEHYQFDWSGEGLAAGIYYYEVKVGEWETCKSWLHILR